MPYLWDFAGFLPTFPLFSLFNCDKKIIKIYNNREKSGFLTKAEKWLK
jgi:hypothetical protein